MKFIWTILILIICSGQRLSAGDILEAKDNNLLKEGRKQFGLSVQAESSIKPAVQAFEQLRRQFPAYSGRAQVYLGALEAIKGKHSFWPHQKIAYVNQALDMMDDGLAQKPQDLEALFVYANINYNLPFFFGRKEQGRKSYRKIVQLLPESFSGYDPPFIADMIGYLQQNLEWSQKDLAVLKQVRQKINHLIAGVESK